VHQQHVILTQFGFSDRTSRRPQTSAESSTPTMIKPGGDCSALRPGSAMSMNVIIGVPSHNAPILVVAVAVDGHDHWSAVSWDLGPGCDEGPHPSVLPALQRASKISDTEDVVV
jgi:hypothetical protein